MILTKYDFVLKTELKPIEETVILSFSGGGLIGLFYHLGVIEYLYKSNFLNNRIIALGSSAGSWAAMIILYLQFNKP